VRAPAPKHDALDQFLIGHAVRQALAGVGHIDLVLVTPEPWLPIAQPERSRRRVWWMLDLVGHLEHRVIVLPVELGRVTT
jgi:hypothetical protein